MWSKTPFRSRQPIDHSTEAGTTSADQMQSSAKIPLSNQPVKSLPRLPHEPTAPATGTYDATALPPSRKSSVGKEDSSVSPAISPTLSLRTRDSDESFCVSSIGDDDHNQEYSYETPSAFNPLNPGRGAPEPFLAVHSRPSRERLQLSQGTPRPPHLSSAAPKQPVPAGLNAANDPSRGVAGWQTQAPPRSAAFHKSSGSHTTNLFSWGREQFQPRNKHERARGRMLSRSRNEIDSSPYGQRSMSQNKPPARHARRDTISPPQDTNLGFVPTVVTTITAGPPNSFQARQVTESVNKVSPRLEPLPPINTEEDFLFPTEPQSTQPAVPGIAMNAGNNIYNNLSDSSHEDHAAEPEATDGRTSSIMSRRRPIPIAMPTSKKPVRKPIPSKTSPTSTIATHLQPGDGPKDTLSRIEALEARRDELAKRRFNLETVIHELTRVIQPTSTIYDQAAKAEVKRSVQSIENEIAEIKREEHELGLKATRAWRKLDERENHGDGSNLWVKRVTS
ncbi:Uncharacterized protein PECH_006831 [Penicillium ucsense]|uniref:BHLH domain-containing protein n=1 Tax=Penicillium ucsense TaxID=2839758 RepID=A0A8J8VVW4_9EURO|nr:Uncharacterized protein PECM_002973 [Penicillium ucsense]KAF7735315.1 Uncharacterized protein PECH_006831 [Penicillium ucsense]